MEKLLLVTVFLVGCKSEVPIQLIPVNNVGIKIEKTVSEPDYKKCSYYKLEELIRHGKTKKIMNEAWEEYKTRPVAGYYTGIDTFFEYAGTDEIANEAWDLSKKLGNRNHDPYYIKHGKTDYIKNSAFDNYNNDVLVYNKSKYPYAEYVSNGPTDYIRNTAWDYYKDEVGESECDFYAVAGKTEYIRDYCKNKYYDISNFIKK